MCPSFVRRAIRDCLRALAFVCVGLHCTSWSATIHVPANSPSIRDAINSAHQGDTIELASGVYFESQFVLDANTSAGLTIRGATSNRNDVVLNGSGQNWMFQLQQWPGGRFENLTIANANARSGAGAAIAVFTGSTSPSVEIVNCRFVNCRLSEGSGGALTWAGRGHLLLRNCQFESNQTGSGGSTGSGGAIHLASVGYDVINCQFIDNITEAGGGAAAFTDDASGSISGCLFRGNLVTSSQGTGGALWFGPGTATISNSSFEQNAAGLGPSVAFDHTTCTASNCDLDAPGYITGANTRVTLNCCVLANLAGWNVLPVVTMDGCAVGSEVLCWGAVKSMYR